ncbi:MAG: prepilin-type N-terminal cleavage/methylation domain-containing protein [Azonexaceae bacterium]|nr:prepilin-type N-terminal cleavage/methylation domain-containing protein [Azonexaceae bacterium]
MQRKHRGFTLIEIAIVLIIIGLLLGGVLKGQEMINQGKIRSIAKELDSISVAVLGYRDRYKALPGDDDKADGRWAGIAKGNGNGAVGGDFNSTTTTDESNILWRHLRRAGFVSGDANATTLPLNAAGGILGVQSDLKNAAGPLIPGISVCATELPAAVANAIDAQLDDGKPDAGTIRGFSQSAANTPDLDTVITAYTDDGKALFTLCKPV